MTPFILSLAIRLTILMIAGGLVALAVRRSTYAVRHVVVAATLACAIVLPAMMLIVPAWRVGVLPASAMHMPLYSRGAMPSARPGGDHASMPQSMLSPVVVSEYPASPLSEARESSASSSQSYLASMSAAAPAPISAPFAPTTSQIALGIWLLGMFVGVAWIALGRLGLARIRRHATPLATQEWSAILETERRHASVAQKVTLLESRAVTSPVTWGVLSPVIVLPDAAHSWSLDRKRVVIMHEMAHIARRDSATQLAATLASIVYWAHPLVLLAARRLRAECERACDERVLELGTPATDYAAHLLDVAKFARSFGAASIVSVAMARPSQLEGRLIAVLRSSPHRARASARSRAAATLFAATLLIAISAFMPVEREVSTSPSLRSPLTRVSELPNGRALANVSPSASRDQDSAAPVASAAAVASVSPVASAAPVAWAAPVAFPASAASPVALISKRDTLIEKSVSAKSGGTLDLELDTGGEITITGTDESKVTVNGFLAGTNWRQSTVSLDGKNGDAHFESRYEHSSGNQSFDNTFTIRVPKKYNVHVSSAGGGVTISGVEGTFRGTTGGGPIVIDHARGEARLSTGGGDIRISESHLDGSVTSGGGMVVFNNVTGGILSGAGRDGASRKGYFYGFGTPGGKLKMPKFKVDVPGAKFDMPNVNFKMPNIKYKTLDDADMKMMMDAQGPEMEAAREAMARAQESLEQNGGEIERARIMIESDSESIEGDSAMERARESLQRNQGAMDSARVIIERNREVMENARQSMRESRKSMLRQPMIVTTKHMRLKDGNVIVIDKDGGDIELGDAPHGARVTTGGGAIIVGRSRGVVSAETGGGDIEIGPAEGAAAATTGAGNVSINLVGSEPHPVDVSSGKGNVDIILPKDANATLDLETAYTKNCTKHSKISGDFPLTVTETNEWDASQGTPRKYVRVRQKIGNGGPVIRVRTVNGDIRLKRGS